MHPTTYGPPSNGKYNADINDEALNQKTDSGVIKKMIPAFAGSCNVFAPRYRQVNIEVLGFSDAEQEKYLSIATGDVKSALEYYLENLNNGRPFILAGHSQGSDVIQMILLQNPGIIDDNQLVAAFVPGWNYTDSILSELGLPLCETPDQIGGVITWNTIGPGGISPVLKDGARCVNPLSWTTDTLHYPAEMDIETSIQFVDGNIEKIPHFTSARINAAGALEIPSPDTNIVNQLNMSMGPEVYHAYDYDFFFQNLTDNVALRCSAYLEKHLSAEK